MRLKLAEMAYSRTIRGLLAVVATVFLASCDGGAGTQSEAKKMISKRPFGKANGADVELYTLTNTNGLRAEITTYGALLVRLDVPDKNGNLANICLGFDNLESYLPRHPYFGATIGRYCNRIAGGKFTLDGKEFTLATNNGPNHLHGGEKGFDRVVWKAEPMEGDGGPSVKFSYTSPDGEEGYPGALSAEVTYRLTNEDELRIDYRATTDKATPCNLTHHSYFNLAGPGTGDILSHELTLTSSKYLATDDTLIPTGEIADVKGTPMDFTTAKTIGSRIAEVPGGYDLCYVLQQSGGGLRPAAKLKDPKSGRVMEIYTDQPGIQFYSGNFLDGSQTGHGGVYKKHYGLCLETQHYPDSPNQPSFPSTILRPGKVYTHTIVHKFSTE